MVGPCACLDCSSRYDPEEEAMTKDVLAEEEITQNGVEMKDEDESSNASEHETPQKGAELGASTKISFAIHAAS